MASVNIIDDMPKTDIETIERYYALRHLQVPAFPGFQYGFFYGTQCRSRRLVGVPIDHGVDRLMSINDLYTECWVPSNQAPNIRNMNIGRLYVDTFPLGSTLRLDYAYTIFYVPQRGISTHVPLNTCPPILRANVPWYGNILVVRHGRRKPVINVDFMDAHLIELILASFIADGILQD
ncbi:hypothetical protein DFH07DRAFT_962038 [Mycena maculata]|uniref:Uncharacterized protein n=1 Tax=Mycena maculata TaxID=230809 RepID=A0AAD7IRN3_9AGAR|nr:hypothetical protein DFH07DRAFT_962038 [Mycena maculata]